MSNCGILIVDFDDTICLHETADKSDISKGKPNQKLIDKLKELSNIGYKIYIYTARGHLSTSSREEAAYIYADIINKWLDDHEVPCDRMSFQKPLGVYYIDDKAVRPDELDYLEELLKESKC